MHMCLGEKPLYTLFIDSLRSFKYLSWLCVEHEYAQSDLSHFLTHNSTARFAFSWQGRSRTYKASAHPIRSTDVTGIPVRRR